MLLRRTIFAALLVLALAPSAYAQTYAQKSCGAASTCIAKATPGSFLDGYITPNVTAGWLFIFNSATAPTNGSVTIGNAAGNAQDCIYIPASNSQGLSVTGLPPESFSAGITLAFSSTGCATLTLATPLFMKARTQ